MLSCGNSLAGEKSNFLLRIGIIGRDVTCIDRPGNIAVACTVSDSFLGLWMHEWHEGLALAPDQDGMMLVFDTPSSPTRTKRTTRRTAYCASSASISHRSFDPRSKRQVATEKRIAAIQETRSQCIRSRRSTIRTNAVARGGANGSVAGIEARWRKRTKYEDHDGGTMDSSAATKHSIQSRIAELCAPAWPTILCRLQTMRNRERKVMTVPFQFPLIRKKGEARSRVHRKHNHSPCAIQSGQ